MSGTEFESEDPGQERRRLIREVRQRLENLSRAGLTSVPRVELTARSIRLDLQAAKADPVENAPAPRTEPSKAPAQRTTPSVGEPPQPPPPEKPKVEAPGRNEAPPPQRSSPAPSLSVASLFEAPRIDSPPVPAEQRPALLQVMAAEVAACRKCPHLAETRTKTVFSDGSPTARLMFIGEAPGADEDRTGIPFVGRAGQLLTDMITKGMGLKRQDVYIANILKCRPPENRDPTPEESSNCIGYLERQIEIVRPEFLCLLGRIAVQRILETTLSMSRLRGKWYRYRGIPAVATYHPAYLLRNPPAKKEAWEDLQMLMTAMGLSVPGRKKGQG